MERGFAGGRCRRRPTSSGRLLAFLKLHVRQALTTFSHTARPPRDLGTTWSMVMRSPPLRPQYWQVYPSRFRMFFLVNEMAGRTGRLMYRWRRITEGITKARGGGRNTRLPSSTRSAFPAKSRTNALRAPQTWRGSNVWFSTRTLSASIRRLVQTPEGEFHHGAGGLSTG